MEGFMEILVNGFNFGDLGAYLQLASGQITLETLFGSYFEGLKVFIDNFIIPLFS